MFIWDWDVWERMYSVTSTEITKMLHQLIQSFVLCVCVSQPLKCHYNFHSILLARQDLLSVTNYLPLLYIFWLNCVCKTHCKRHCWKSFNFSSSLQCGCQVLLSYRSMLFMPALHKQSSCYKIHISTMEVSSHD